MESIRLQGLQQCTGEIHVPGSKSIANRALLMAALCASQDDAPALTELTNLLRSDDTERMLEALQALGVGIEFDAANPTTVRVIGCGGHWSQIPQQLYLGNAGTAMRPLVAVLATTLSSAQSIELTGDARMQERPIRALVSALLQADAGIQYLAEEGYPPLRIRGGMHSGSISIDGSESSQYVSALLMALPLLPHESLLTLTGTVVSWPYIELTLAMLERFGIEIHRIAKHEFMIPGGQQYRSPQQYWVEGDASSASYWLAAGVLGGGPLRVHGIGSASIQGDVAFAEQLQAIGGKVTVAETYIDVAGGQIHGFDADLNAIPDAAMTFATLALFAAGPTTIRNIANWRIKETDRLAAMATELRKVGATIEEGSDYIQITPPAVIAHAHIDTYDDHRMAMSFALLGFSTAGVTIRDPNCCRKTYPDFFTKFQQYCH
ncbi:3-phosphoshikimate 1-carboxyvinyltransferase [Pseudidiomarina aestuarii]|uniref:3-phosphoshikimate 1-carboxyvinyltransferase n=1 Tax=Pseudidiomarina aestuarii TaxID=624146 RepID=UPI003A983530